MMNFNQVSPQITVGSCPRTAEDITRLSQAGVTAVLNLQHDDDLIAEEIDWTSLAKTYQSREIQVARVPVVDLDPQAMLEKIITATRRLNDLISAQHHVYVHCTAGRERSPTTVVCYLAWYEELGMTAALQRVRDLRRCNPYESILEAADKVFHQK